MEEDTSFRAWLDRAMAFEAAHIAESNDDTIPAFKNRESLRAILYTDFLHDDSFDKLEKGSESSLNLPRESQSTANAPAKDPNIVDWNGPGDSDNPQNWPKWRKWIITCASCMMAAAVTFASSIFSTASVATSEEFHVSTEVTTLGTSLFLAGFIIGPLSEYQPRPC